MCESEIIDDEDLPESYLLETEIEKLEDQKHRLENEISELRSKLKIAKQAENFQ